MACRSGCRTQDHESWGACAKAAGIQIDRHSLKHGGVEKDKDRRLTRYADARSSGLQPRSTKWSDIRAAEEKGGVPHTPVVEKPATYGEMQAAHANVRATD